MQPVEPGLHSRFRLSRPSSFAVPAFGRRLEGYPVPTGFADVLSVSAACRLATAPILWLHFGSGAAVLEPLRRIYDLRHAFVTFALHAGVSTFDLSRYMGASLTMIDRHYGHLAGHGREARRAARTQGVFLCGTRLCCVAGSCGQGPARLTLCAGVPHGARGWELRSRIAERRERAEPPAVR